MATINSIDSNIPIEILKGGTDATSFATSNGTVIFDGTRLVTLASTGSSTQVLTSNGASAPSFAPAPTTSMLFQVLVTDPGSPVNSQVWYNSTSNTFKCYQGGAVKTFTVS